MILVTGGAGFVGLNVAEQLLARGDEVVIYDRSPPRTTSMRPILRAPFSPFWTRRLPRTGYTIWATARRGPCRNGARCSRSATPRSAGAKTMS